MPCVSLPYPISANRMVRHFHGRAVKSKEARQYQVEAGFLAKQAGCLTPLSGPVEVSILLHPRKPKRPSKTLTRSLDVDNAVKVVLDSLNGIAWRDDRQIERLTVIRCEPIPDGALVVRWDEVDA
jgi:crossover junction endodeoxyribonuclease RusA